MTTEQSGRPAAAGSFEVLSYWHKIEFFIPYDLQGLVMDAKDGEWSVRPVYEHELATLTPQSLWSPPVPAGRKLSGFEVYFGAFDKTELADITQRVVNEALSDADRHEQDERAELEGLTCAASLRMHANGAPRLEELCVSTVPWALGRIAQRGLSALDFDAFQADLESLKRNVKAFRAAMSGTSFPAGQDSLPFTARDLLALLKILSDWSGYPLTGRGTRTPVLVIRAKSVEDRAKPAGDPIKDKSPVAAEAREDEEEEGAESASDTEISILNSFFAEDLALAMASVGQGSASAALQAYLAPLPASARVDLYQSGGHRVISERLRPAALNHGRWPGNPAHAMSLMQQFAVNSIFKKLKDAGLFSVNGPPGTGKTTLLREVMAENIVRRARALSRCATARDAFQRESQTVSFGGESVRKVSVLKDELVGFEMVVASSNNAAVENISRDLPRNKSLGRPVKPGEAGWRAEAGHSLVAYLQPVARNLLERNSKGFYERPASDDDAWGLISCALGKKRNRDAFVRGIGQAGPTRDEKAPKGFDPARHQSIWTWRNNYAGSSFAQAKRAFCEADESVRELASKLDRYAALVQEFKGVSLDAFCDHWVADRAAASRAHADAEWQFKRLDEEWSLSLRQVELLRAEEVLIERRRPGWWTRFVHRRLRHAHEAELEDNRRDQARWLRRQYESEPKRQSAKQALELAVTSLSEADSALSARRLEWQDLTLRLEAMRRKFPQAAHPELLDELEEADWQVQGLWHCQELNERRSALLVAALQLHEAWLAETLQRNAGFGGNVVALSKLLEGKPIQDKGAALTLWRSLFMIVPVVSSTFASFGRQFRHLGPSSIGWLFIDEAGQAVPQAAVGALWRAQRAVVVGDPMQIEPVFTVPVKLIAALAKTHRLPQGMTVAPDKASVQNLADESNELGTSVEVGGKSQWIGSPLRVHRRCVDPMFSIANEIAYDGKMIYFAPQDPSARQPPPHSLDLGPSAWVHLSGFASDRQVVGEQIDLIHQAALALYGRLGALPPIYIVSPFKRIKNALLDRLSRKESWVLPDGSPHRAPTPARLSEWCKERIGTVHTFQGKEEVIVWMVLGCDEASAGAAHWASSKPNLLNVAVTRAKHRCFVIGDTHLWGGLQNFVAAHAGRLPRIKPHEFLQRVGAAKPGPEIETVAA